MTKKRSEYLPAVTVLPPSADFNDLGDISQKPYQKRELPAVKVTFKGNIINIAATRKDGTVVTGVKFIAERLDVVAKSTPTETLTNFVFQGPGSLFTVAARFDPTSED